MSALVWAYLQVDGQGGWLEGFMLVTRTVCRSQQILKSVPMNDFIELKYRLDGITFQHPDNNVFFILIRNLLCHNSDEYFWGYWICPFHKGTVSQKRTLKDTFVLQTPKFFLLAPTHLLTSFVWVQINTIIFFSVAIFLFNFNIAV